MRAVFLYDSKTERKKLEELGYLGIGFAYSGLPFIKNMMQDAELIINFTHDVGMGQYGPTIVPTVLNAAGIEYLGYDTLALSVSLDRPSFRSILSGFKAATPNYVLLNSPEDLTNEVLLKSVRYPCVIKPVSTLGPAICERNYVGSLAELVASVDELYAVTQDKLIVEDYIPGREIWCLAFDHSMQVISEVKTTGKLKNFNLYGVEAQSVVESASQFDFRPLFFPSAFFNLTASSVNRALMIAGAKDFSVVKLRIPPGRTPFIISIDQLGFRHATSKWFDGLLQSRHMNDFSTLLEAYVKSS